MKSNYNIISKNLDLAHYIYMMPVSISYLELSDKIYEKFGIKISTATLFRFKSNLPKSKINSLRKNRVENINILKFIIEKLKNELTNNNNVDQKLDISKEILSLIKELDEQINKEIERLQLKDPY